MREGPLLMFALSAAFLAMVVSGGPQAASEIRRDDTRESDIRSWSGYDACLKRADEASDCQKPERAADPYTGVPYRKETGPDRWCADFDRPEDVRQNVQGGCVLNVE